jgi:hypothetical protein
MSEQARKISHRAIPEWAQGLYYNSGIMSEVLVYHDDESIYFEHKGKESGIVRFTFEMIETEDRRGRERRLASIRSNAISGLGGR